MNKRAWEISLHFIIGLFFTVALILIVIGALGKLSDIVDPHYERSLIDNWIVDIDLINQDTDVYTTELLSLKDVKGEYLIFLFQQTSKTIIGVNEKTGENLEKPRTCAKSSCICSFSTESNDFDYCKKIGADQLMFYRVPYESEDYFVIANEDVEIQEDASKDKIVVTNNVFAYRNGKKIVFCFELENGICTS